MSKILKEPQVHVPCPTCGKTQRLKLKWAVKHKSCKCPACRESVDLKAAPAKSLIARTAGVVGAFVNAMEALQGEAKRDAKAFKARRKAAKMAKKKHKKNTHQARKSARKPAKKAAPRKASKPSTITLPILPPGSSQPGP